MVELDLADIGESIAAALRADERFAAPDAVRRGRFALPPTIPFACVTAPALSSEQGPVMGSYTRTVVYDVLTWDAAPSNDSDSAVAAVERLADAVHLAIEVERTRSASPLYSVPELRVRTAALVGGEVNIPGGRVFCLSTVELRYRRRSGLLGVST